MATILAFPSSPIRARPPRVEAQQATIVIFPGVRYEGLAHRTAESNAAAAAQQREEA